MSNIKDARTKYADIIDLPHHQSAVYKHMSLYNRAAQFAPFAALSGYDDMIAEEGRQTEQKQELSETELRKLNQQLDQLQKACDSGERPVLTFFVFVPDLYKDGGKYDEITAAVRRVDTVNQVIVLDKRIGISGMYQTIRFDSIMGMLEGDSHGTQNQTFSYL